MATPFSWGGGPSAGMTVRSAFHSWGEANMGHSTAGLPSGSESTRQDVLVAMILALAAGLGLCMAFGLGFWVRGVIDRDAVRSVRPDLASAGGGQPAEARPDPPAAVAAGPA